MVFGNDTVYNAGTGNTFTLCYDKFGAVKWAASAGGNVNDGSNGIATDGLGNCYMTGSFTSDTMYLDTFALSGSAANCTNGCYNAFIVKYNSSGKVAWARRVGSKGVEHGQAVIADALGCYATGFFNSDSLVIGTDLLVNAGGTCSQMTCSDTYLVRFDSSGIVMWARSVGGSNDDVPSDVAEDPYGNCILTGTFHSGQVTIGATTLYNSLPGASEVMLAGFDFSGNPLWAQSGGYSGNDNCYSIGTDEEGNIYISGAFSGDTTLFSNIMLFSNDTAVFDIFIGKLTPYTVSGIGEAVVNDLRIYPNPASESFTVSGLSHPAVITLLDATGSEISRLNTSSYSCTIYAGDLKPGLYLVRIDGEFSRSLKLIKAY